MCPTSFFLALALNSLVEAILGIPGGILGLFGL